MYGHRGHCLCSHCRGQLTSVDGSDIVVEEYETASGATAGQLGCVREAHYKKLWRDKRYPEQANVPALSVEDKGECPVRTCPPRLCGRRCSVLSRSGWPCGNPCKLPKNHGEDHRCAYHQDRDHESSGEEIPDVVVSATWEALEIVAGLPDVPLKRRVAPRAGPFPDKRGRSDEVMRTRTGGPEDRPNVPVLVRL